MKVMDEQFTLPSIQCSTLIRGQEWEHIASNLIPVQRFDLTAELVFEPFLSNMDAPVYPRSVLVDCRGKQIHIRVDISGAEPEEIEPVSSFNP